MGLLTVPKKYNPPGNGKRDMEYPIYATKSEQRLLKSRGGAGKMTKHGLLSFGLGDKGNEVGSAGGSHAAGDGKGGQIDTRSFGKGTSGVLRSIGGKWTVVDRSSGAPIGGGSKAAAPVRVAPAIPSAIPTAITPAAIPASTLAAQYGMYKNPTAGLTPGQRVTDVYGPSYALDPSIAGRAHGSAGQKVTDVFGPSYARDPSISGRLSQPTSSLGYQGGVPAGQKVTDVFGPSYARDPSINGRLNQPPQNPAASPAQQQSSGIFSRALSDSQLGNPAMGNPNNAGYRAAVTASEALGGPAATQAENVYKALGFDDNQRAAMLGRNAVESGYFDPKVLDGTRMGDAGTAYGLGQWRGERQAGVKDFIGGIEGQQSSPAAQAAAIVNEMQFKEQPSYKALNAAQTLPQAMAAMNQYERPQGYKPGGNPASVVGYNDAMKYGQNYLSNPPSQQTSTMMASASPTMAPPTKPFDWNVFSALPGSGMVKTAYNSVNENVIQPTEQQIEKYGGFENASKLAGLAVSMSKFMGDVSPGEFGPGGQERRGGSTNMGGGGGSTPATPTTTPPVTTPPTTVAQLLYPQYTQSSWLGLPTGAYGTPWKPSAPTGGIFDEDTKDKKKKGGGYRNA